MHSSEGGYVIYLGQVVYVLLSILLSIGLLSSIVILLGGFNFSNK